MSPKSSRGRPRHAAPLLRHTRLRRPIWVPKHATTERRYAAIERQRKRQIEVKNRQRLRRAASTVIPVAASAFVFAAPTASGLSNQPLPYAAIRQYYAPIDYGHADSPHTPDPDPTLYAAYEGSGTATATVKIGPGSPRGIRGRGRTDRCTSGTDAAVTVSEKIFAIRDN